MHMIFVSVEDFYEKAGSCSAMDREEEIACARRMQSGDPDAREQLIRSYLPAVARLIKGQKAHMQTLGLVLYCVQALEKAVDSFDFFQESETFSHRLSWYMRQAVIKYIVR